MVFAPNRRVEAEAGIARAMKHAGADDLAAYLVLVRGDATRAGRSRRRADGRGDPLHAGPRPDGADPPRGAPRPPSAAAEPAPPLRVWSAGCATGEEAYSLAILLEEEGLDEGAVVLGTDLSAAALEKARAGSYSDWSMRGVSDRFLQDYFRHVRGRRILVDRIRNRVRFERLNLVGHGRLRGGRRRPGWTSSSAATSSSTSTTRRRDGSPRGCSTAWPKAECCSPRAPTRSSASTPPSRSR